MRGVEPENERVHRLVETINMCWKTTQILPFSVRFGRCCKKTTAPRYRKAIRLIEQNWPLNAINRFLTQKNHAAFVVEGDRSSKTAYKFLDKSRIKARFIGLVFSWSPNEKRQL